MLGVVPKLILRHQLLLLVENTKPQAGHTLNYAAGFHGHQVLLCPGMRLGEERGGVHCDGQQALPGAQQMA